MTWFRDGRWMGLAAMLLTAAVACGGTAATGSTSVAGVKAGHLEVGVLWPQGSPEFPAAERVGNQLIKKVPGTTITYTFANTAARPKLDLRWQQGDPPDVDQVFNGASPSTYHLATDDQLYDLTNDVKTTQWDNGQSWEQAIRPAFRPFLTYQGKYLAVPDQAVLIGLYFNQKVLNENGVKPPQTWGDLMNACSTLNAKGIAPIEVAGTSPYYKGMWFDYLLMREVGPQAAFDIAWGKTRAADNPGVLRAAQHLQEMVQNHCFAKGFEGSQFTAVQLDFFRGKAGMILMGTWLVGEMKTSIPSDFQLGITPFPTLPDGASAGQQALFGTAFAWSVAAKSKDPKLAVEYLRLEQSKQEQAQRAKDLGNISPYTGVPVPAGVSGLDNLLAKTDKTSVTIYYFGLNKDKQHSDAWYTPVAQLFFGKIDPQQMVSQIDANEANLKK